MPGKNGKWIEWTDEGSVLPNAPGCYAIYEGDEVVYVGSSFNIRHRIKSHPIEISHYSNTLDTPWGMFHNWKIKFKTSVRYGDWAMIELRLIDRLQPKYNKAGIRRSRKDATRQQNSLLPILS